MKRNHSVQKAVAILRAAGDQPEGVTGSGLARSAGLPHPTALRLIHTLEEEGFLMRLPSGRYVVGLDLLRLRRAATGELLIAVARRTMAQLAETTLESATLTVPRGRDGQEVLLQIDGPHLIGLVNWLGGRYPLHATSGGRALLATWDEARLAEFLKGPFERHTAKTVTEPAALRREIERTRERRYSVMVDELEVGLAAIGTPIFDGDLPGFGRGHDPIGVVNLSGPTFRFDAQARTAAAPHLLAAAEAIARELRPAAEPIT